MNVGVILSGGIGSRFGLELPKQYCMLGGRPIIEYSVRALRESGRIGESLIVCQPDHKDRLEREYGLQCVEGGATRNGSLSNALAFVGERYPECGGIIFLEAARPFVTAKLVDEYLALLEEYDGVITCQQVTDSLGSEDDWVVDRQKYFLVQAPEAFRFQKLSTSFDSGSPITATYQQMDKDSRVFRNFSFPENLKITRLQDLGMAEWILRNDADVE